MSDNTVLRTVAKRLRYVLEQDSKNESYRQLHADVLEVVHEIESRIDQDAALQRATKDNAAFLGWSRDVHQGRDNASK